MDNRIAPKDLAPLRLSLFKKQKGVDPITGTPITAPCLDHDHESGVCRMVLQREVNSAEGKVYNAYKRYIRHLGVDFGTFLKGMLRYHRKDFSGNPIHPTHRTEDEKRERRNRRARVARKKQKQRK